MLAGFRRHLKYLAHKLHILCHVIPTKWRSCRDHRLCDVTSPCVYKRPPLSNEVDDTLRRSTGRGEIFEARAEFGTKFQREVTLFILYFLITQCRISRRKRPCQKCLHSSSHFARTLTCDRHRQTQRHR